MNLQAHLSLVNELISKMDDVISKGALIGDKASTDTLRDVNVQVSQLIRTLFPDADKRLDDFGKSKSIAARRDGPSIFRKSFMEQAKAIRRYLISIRDSINIRTDVEAREVKLDKLRKEVGEKEVEANRREKVAETKFYGAAIEIIDRLRDQLKDKGGMQQEIIKMRSELAEIKELLKEITKEFIPKEKEDSELL